MLLLLLLRERAAAQPALPLAVRWFIFWWGVQRQAPGWDATGGRFAGGGDRWCLTERQGLPGAGGARPVPPQSQRNVTLPGLCGRTGATAFWKARRAGRAPRAAQRKLTAARPLARVTLAPSCERSGARGRER